MTDLTPDHPSIEEVRRHWGLAVDIHRRDERLAEFDRLIQAVRAEALSAVAELHTPKDNGRVSMCCSCEQWIESSDDEACIEYPCPTVEAITEALEEV